MALPTYHCLECEKDFQAPNWVCATGANHVVEEKRYYMADAPTCVELRNGMPYVNKRDSCTRVLNIPPEKKVEEAGEIQRIPGGIVDFVRGMFATTDPEIQFYLDKKEGLCSKERWEEVYLTDNEKMELHKLKMQSQFNRLEQNYNELLAKVKASEAEAKPERKKPGPKPRILQENPA